LTEKITCAAKETDIILEILKQARVEENVVDVVVVVLKLIAHGKILLFIK